MASSEETQTGIYNLSVGATCEMKSWVQYLQIDPTFFTWFIFTYHLAYWLIFFFKDICLQEFLFKGVLV